ncbi:MAG: hypothetical protein NC924_02395 [Candidatus Omnitrophica bacterium]|nr:hypothetical protein [Candidatus Omnitrophota bacterium]
MVNPLFMRAVDKYAGQPLCGVLSLIRIIGDFFQSGAVPITKPRRILFIKFTEQGSLVLAYPALRKAVRLVGRQQVFIFASRDCRELLELLDCIPPENIIDFDMRTIPAIIHSFLNGIVLSRARGIDTVIDLELFTRASAIFTYLCGAKIRAGIHRFHDETPYRGDLFTHRLLFNPHLHMKNFFIHLVAAVTHAVEGSHPLQFSEPKDDLEIPAWVPTEHAKREFINRLEKNYGLRRDSPIVIFNPKLTDLLPLRRWPSQKYVQLGRMIRAAYPHATILITGVTEEKDMSVNLARQIGGAFSLAGETTLAELLLLFHLSDLLITSDSGPAHFASLTPIKTLVLFGPETARRFGPTGKNQQSISADIICSPCLTAFNHRHSGCTNARCMKKIRVADVFAAAQNMLGVKAAAGSLPRSLLENGAAARFDSSTTTNNAHAIRPGL